MFGRLMRRLVRWLRRRRYARTAARVRALEVELGYAQPSFVEQHFNPDLIDWGDTRRARRERDRLPRTHSGYMAGNVGASEMGPLPRVLFEPGLGQRCPKGTVRPPLITVQGETPPPAVYVPEDR